VLGGCVFVSPPAPSLKLHQSLPIDLQGFF
jgi:hypothetical protein